MADNSSATLYRGERVLAYMVASTLGLSVLAIVALFIIRAVGASIEGTPLAVVAVLPLVGLPIAFLLILALLLVSIVRRVRGSRDA
ncbi:MAG: hypothetical protein QM635_11585 [Microbacteriaceae bacterium]